MVAPTECMENPIFRLRLQAAVCRKLINDRNDGMNKYKKLALNTLIFSIGSFSSKLLSFLLVRFYTEYLTRTETSTFDLVCQTANLLVPIATLSITEGVIRYGLDAKYDKKQIYSIGFFTTLLGCLIIIPVLPLTGMIPELKSYTVILFIYLLASGFRMLNQYFLRATGKVKLFAVDGIFTTFTMLILNVLFIAVFRWGAMGYVLSIVISDALSSVFICFFSKNLKYLQFKNIDKTLAKDMIKYSIPLIPTFILWWIVSSSDKYMIRLMLNPESNGIYSVSYKIPTIISIVSTIFFQAWQMSAITEYNSEDTEKFYSQIFSAYQSILFIASAGILMILTPLSKLLFAAEYYQAYHYIPFLLSGVLMSCFCQFMSSIYSAVKQTKNSLWTSMIAAAANIILNFILIPNPHFGIQGAALATMISYMLCFIVRAFDTRRYVNYSIPWKSIIINFAILLAMSWASMVYSPLDSHIITDGDEVRKQTIFLICGFVMMAVFNFQALSATVKKVLKR